MHSIWDGLDNNKCSRRAVAKLLTMKRLSSFTRATPIHEKCRRRNVCYCNCIFLGNTGGFLAIDDQGVADIIRPSHGTLLNPTHGRCVASREPATVDSFQAIDRNSTIYEQQIGLFSIKRGKAFAITLPDGGLKLFDTETNSSFEFSKDPKSFGLTEAHPGRIGHHCSLRGWISRGPFRAGDHTPSIALRQQLHISSFPTFMETANTHGSPGRTRNNPTTSCCPSAHQTGWDLRESPVLSAVHIGQFRDTFAFRFFDERTSKHHTIVNLNGDGEQFTLRDVCYCSDYSVATATNTSISLWDIRMLRNQAKTIQLKAFPNDVAHAMVPSVKCENVAKGGNSNIRRICCLHSGDVLALTKSSFHLIDPRMNLELKTSANPIDCDHVTAVDKNFGVLASYNPEAMIDRSHSHEHQTIKLYDAYQMRSSRKRKQDNGIEIATHIIDDETETSTTLNSLSFNSTGDSLVGCSVDGNVFLFN